MASPMLPSSVSFFMSRLQGVSTSSFKIFPDTATSGVSGGQIVRFSLPANTLLNFRSIRFLFNCTTTNGTDAGSIPASTSSFIDRLAMYAGGVLVQNGHQNYHVLRHAKYALCGSKDNPTLEHPEFCRNVSYHDGSDLGTGTGNESYADVDDALGVLSWEGFLGSCEPYILDTGLLPQLTLEITLADGVVFGSSKGRLMSGTGSNTDFDDDGTVACTYTLNNLSLECEVLGMASSVLDQIVEQRISSVGYLSIPFKQYFTTINTHTGSTKFNVNSASWDRLWIAYRADNADQVGAPIVVNGYKKGNANVVRSSALVNGAVSSSATLVIDNLIGEAPKVGDVVKAAGIVTRVTITAVNSATNYTMSAAQSISDNAAVTFERDVGAPQYDVGGSLDTNKEKYYADLKLRRKQEIPQEYTEAYQNYNNLKQEQEKSQQLTQLFLEKTDSVFGDNFKGFDFQVGNNKYRYKVNNIAETKRIQSNISEFVNNYLNDKGEMENATGYHKALFAARNADKLAEHFYQQGRADALRENAREAKNIDMEPRKEGFIETKAGQKFRVVTGDSSSKLRVKLKQ